MGFPTKNDQHLGCEMGVCTIEGNTHIVMGYGKNVSSFNYGIILGYQHLFPRWDMLIPWRVPGWIFGVGFLPLPQADSSLPSLQGGVPAAQVFVKPHCLATRVTWAV